jgi:2-polyprenyl-3-methyl-5-hydroxy-6-metoxy-1,4-benzoquinol methylase
MDYKAFCTYKSNFIAAFRNVLKQKGITYELTEAAFCAYADRNPLIRFLFWRRLWVALKFMEQHGPYDAILDFGTGSGVTLPLVTALTKKAIGLDMTIQPHKDIAQFISFPSEIEFYETSQKPLESFADNSFNTIIALDVLEHVENLEAVGKEFCRITKPGGKIIISGPTESFFYQIGRKIAGEEYTGTYHVRNIFDIRRAVEPLMKIETLATLYYPFPLFKVYIGTVEKNAKSE